TRRLKEQYLGKREVMIRPKMGGGTEQVPLARETTNTFALPLPTIRKLSQLGIAIERHYGTPQDIEWAWVQNETKMGKFFILQARPMTALPEPLKISGPMRMVVPMLAEMWPTRPYPLDMTTFTGTIERAIGNLLVTMLGKSAPSPDESFLEEEGVVVQFKPPQMHPSLSMLFMPWITLWRTRYYDPSRWEADPLLAELIKKAQLLEQYELGSLTWTQNMEIMYEALEWIPRLMQLRERYLPQAILGLAGLWLLLGLTRQSNHFGALISGVKTKTTETNQALEGLAQQIRENPTLRDLFHSTDIPTLQSALRASQGGSAFLERFKAFLDQYGHRETTLTISQPAWKDQPEVVLGILKVLSGAGRQPSDPYEAWQKTRDELLAHSILGTRFLRPLFLKSLRTTRDLFQIREDTHFYATLVQPTIRHVALELGRRLVQANVLNEVCDVFHLQLNELETFGAAWPPSEERVAQIRALVARRKAKRESLANEPMIDPRLLAIPSPARAGEGVLLNGTSGSPGLAQGPVRVVHDASEFGKLQAGDVLVAPVTNPAWTPLFQRAVAVVVDTGGSASHAAIVAREYGIPAVMGTMNGTKELKDGQWIRVDGSRGLVLKAEEHR
ncbi:MAG TPA: PEP-utilizing enzyme, partial [Anaerolineales bacterium]|nr:PEP-utilizing enzyme [Anaerolineales bacterium]